MILTPAEAGGAACDHEDGYVMVAACNEDACPAAVSLVSTGIGLEPCDMRLTPSLRLLRSVPHWIGAWLDPLLW